MELSELNKSFCDRTPVILSVRGDDGTVTENTYTAYHRSLIEVLPKLAEIEEAEKTEVPKVTQMLLALDTQVGEFTHESKPVVMDAEKWAIAGIPVQDAIMRAVWDAKFGSFKFEPSKPAKEKTNAKSKNRDRVKSRTAAASATTPSSAEAQ